MDTSLSEDRSSPSLTEKPSAAKLANDEKTNEDYSVKAQSATTFRHYLRIFTYSTLIDRIALGIALLAEIGTGVTLPLMNIIFGNLTTNFTEYFQPGSTTTKAEFKRTLNHYTLYIVYLFIARWALSYCGLFVFRLVGIRISAKIRLEYLKALFSLPVSALDTFPAGQASNTLTNTANVLQIGISDKLGTFVQFTTLLITAIIIAFTYSWSLTLVTSSVILFIGIVYGIIIPIKLKIEKEVQQADAKAASIAGEILGAVRMIFACGAEDRVTAKYSGWVLESKRRGMRMSLWLGLEYSPIFFGIFSTFALCFWFGFKLLVQGHIQDIGDIVIVLMSVMMISMSIAQTAVPIIAATKAAAAAADFFAVIDSRPPPALGLKEPEITAQEDIVFKDVNFAYPSRSHVKVLDNLDLCFEAGKLTAIVGASGSGKSTIVGLLERWYELDDANKIVIPPSAIKPDGQGEETPGENGIIGRAQSSDSESDEKQISQAIKEPVKLSGSISCGKHNLKDIDLKWWRSQIGLVSQEPFIFNATIRRNIEQGLVGSQWENEDEETKRKLVVEACKEAFADDFITKLPLGYDTEVGDAGIKLSGGQRQRLAIARSIINRPKILILDEATSSIDVRGEQIVQAALDKVSEGRTTITIAHRLSTIKKADKIIVMRHGAVVETGTHDSLLANPAGAYHALVAAQQLSMGDSYSEASDLVESAADVPVQVPSKSPESTAIMTSEEIYKPKGLIRSFGLFLWEQRKLWPWYMLLIIGCAGAGSSWPVQSYIFAQLVNVFTETGDALQAAANHWSLMFLILGIGAGTAYFLLGWSANTVTMNISAHYRREYFTSILSKPISFFDAEENSSGTLNGRLANDPTQLQQLLGINMGMVYIAIFNVTGSVIIALVFAWELALIVTFISLPILAGGGYYRLRYEIQFERMNNEVFAESSKFAAEAIGAFRTVTSLTLEDMICERYDTLLQGHVRKAFLKGRYSSLLFAVSDSLPLLCMAFTFWYGGQKLANKEYNPVNFFVAYIAVTNGAESAGSMLSFGPNMAQASAAANRILAFRNRREAVPTSKLDLAGTDGGVKVELRDVHFKYPTRDVPIFTGLNITVEKGTFAALVGPSGCGKTSIVSLLERFYDVQQGAVYCNGSNITELDVREYRKTISLVAQEPTLFQGTIKENILLGVDESTTTEEQLHRACRDAEIHDFIVSLPEGYSTDVGTKGVALSGGQKQRMSIARALIRNPKILLLDEATSSLDSESEKLVQAAFERAGKGRTVICVAHRLATVQNADVIFVLGEGKVLEKGNHHALLRQRGVYYQMCQSQALDR